MEGGSVKAKRKALLITVIFTAAALAAGLALTGEAAAFYHKKSGSDSGVVEAEITFSAAARGKTEKAMMPYCDSVVRITRGSEAVREGEFHSHTCKPGFTHTFSERGSYEVSITMSYLVELFPVKNKTVSAENTVEVK